MISIILGVFFFIVSIIGYANLPGGTVACDACDGFLILTWVSGAISLVCFIAFAVMFKDIYESQLKDIESITKRRKDKTIYQKKADALCAEFKKYLAVEYPKHEQAIFDKLLPTNATTVIAAFPEIKYSDVIKALL